MMSVLFVALLLFGTLSGNAAAQNSGGQAISAARDLYASARYDEALAVLNEIRPVESSRPDERKTIEQYRSLCLLALGRGGEAEAAIAAVVTMDPFYRPSEAEASPRVRSTFAEVRHRLLPGLASARYTDAKQAYDRKQFSAAAVGFRELVVLLDDPQMSGRLADLRTLAAGFVEIATAAAAPPPAPAPVPKQEAPAPSASVPASPAAPAIYTADVAGIVPPVTIRQDVPAVPAAITGVMMRRQGLVELVIDEKGRIISVALRTSLHPRYDSLLVNAAKDWKYEPARLNGVPVPYRKLLQISVSR